MICGGGAGTLAENSRRNSISGSGGGKTPRSTAMSICSLIEWINANGHFFDYPFRTSLCHTAGMKEGLCIWLFLLPTLLMAPATLAADTNTPAVAPEIRDGKIPDSRKWR